MQPYLRLFSIPHASRELKITKSQPQVTVQFFTPRANKLCFMQYSTSSSGRELSSVLMEPRLRLILRRDYICQRQVSPGPAPPPCLCPRRRPPRVFYVSTV